MLSGLTAAILLAPHGGLRVPRRADLTTVVAVGALQLGIHFALTHLALMLVPAERTSVLANTTTIWVVPLSLLVLGEVIQPDRTVGSALILGSVRLAAGSARRSGGMR